MSESEQQEQEPRDYEAEAAKDGWVADKAKMRDPTKWVDAKTFVERGETFIPYLNANLKKVREERAQLERDVAELREGNRRFAQFHERALLQEKAAREEAIAQLEALRRKAITDGDGDAFDAADRKLQAVRQAPTQAAITQPVDPGHNADVQAWVAENTWYTTDKALHKITDALSDILAEEQPTLKGRAFLDALTARVRAEVPHKFQNVRRAESTTEGHDRRAVLSKQGSKSYEDLPDDARAACDRFIKTMPGFTKEAYLSQYDWSVK